MKIRLADHLVQKLSKIGQAIDIDRQTLVFNGGEVGLSEDVNGKDESNEPERARGPGAGSRQGTPGPRRTAGEAASEGVVGQQVVRVAGLEELYAAYPINIIEGDYGLWIIVKSAPLGSEGPQVTFVVAYPDSKSVPPRAWGFWKLGDFPKVIGPRHTNFPDSSICSFEPDDGTWSRDEGLVALIDLYSTWVICHLYFQQFDHWPGQQYGRTALYRRTEFSSREWCGCGSGKRYGVCHEPADKLVPEEEAREEHRHVLGSDYCVRKPPRSVMKFARSGFKKVPTFKDAYEGR